MKKWRKSSFVSLVAIFAAFNVLCDSLIGPLPEISGVWFSWIFIAEPINGIILGPYASFFSTLIGVMAGHFVYYRGSAEFIFTLGAPLGAMISSLFFRGKWKVPLIYYLALLAAFFVTPVSWQLPIWGMWDVYLAFGCLLISVVIMKRLQRLWTTGPARVGLLTFVALGTFIGLEADVLFRIFILVPCQTYRLIFPNWTVAYLQGLWAAGAIETSVKAALSTFVAIVLASPIVKAARKMGLANFED